MQVIVDDPILFIVAFILLGGLFGVISTRMVLRREATKALEKERAKFEIEKEELSVAMTSQLGEMRDGLLQVVRAYEGAVRTVEDKLPISAKRRQELEAPVEIEIEAQEVIEIEELPNEAQPAVSESDDSEFAQEFSEPVEKPHQAELEPELHTSAELNGNGVHPRNEVR